MFKSNDKKIVISICCLLVILLIVGIVFLVNQTNKNNNTETVKNNKEQFTDIETLSSDELLEKLKSNPDGLQEVVALDNLTETITGIFNSKISENIGPLTKEIEELKTRNVIDNLPKGTIIMWNEETLPSTKWKWCDGKMYNNVQTPDLKYRFPLGGKSYGGEEGKPEGDSDGLIKENNVPKHRHPLNGEGEQFPELAHKHRGETNKDGSHTHIFYANDLAAGAKGPVFETDINRQESLVTVTEIPTSDSTHKHTFTTETSLEGGDKKIKDHIVGEGPIYDEGEVQKPFYPRYTLINFIMKVE